MVEESILRNGILTQEDIQEIHKVFIMLDQEGTGQISIEELRNMASTISKNQSVTMDEAYTLHGMLDKNKDGKVTWDKFLEFVSNWLIERGYVRSKARPDLPSSVSERTALHKGLANLFSLQHVTYDVELNLNDSLENRLETWDYLGEGQIFTEQERENYYSTVAQILLSENGFQNIQDEVFHTDLGIVLSGLKKLRDLLYVIALYESPVDRVKISGYLVRLFDLLLSSNIIARVLQCLGADSAIEIQWEALKIITLFSPGPRIPGLTIDHPLHASKKLPKNMLISSGALGKLEDLCESPCVEVRDQALLAIGFTVRHDPDIRDYLSAMNYIEGLQRLLTKGAEGHLELTSLLRCVWVVSLFCGATMPRDHAKPTYSVEVLTGICSNLVSLFHLHDQENLIANCMTGLSYILPVLPGDQFTKDVLVRVVTMLSHGSSIVKRSSLQAIRQVLLFNPALCQLITEIGIYSKLSEILSLSHESLIKLDACSVIRYLIMNGYAWEILNLSTTVHSLINLITGDKEVRWEAIRLVKVILETQNRIVADKMAQFGLLTAIFSALGDFRDVSPTINEIYNVTCVTYNFSYLYDCSLVLAKFVGYGWPGGDFNRENDFKKYLGQNEAVKLFDVIKCLIEEVRKGHHDLYQLNHGEIRIEKGLNDLLEVFIRTHSFNMQDKDSEFLVGYLNNVLNFLRSHLQTANFSYLSQHGVNLATLVNCVGQFNIKWFDEVNYPNGDNRLLQNLSKQCLGFFALQTEIANAYGCNKNMYHVDIKGDKITINNEDTIQYAIFNAIQLGLEEFVGQLTARGQQIPNPLVIPAIEVRLIVSGIANVPFCAPDYQSGFAQSTGFNTWQSKESTFQELMASHHISFDELEAIHQEFLRVSDFGQTQDGRVDFQQFSQIMSTRVPNSKVIQDLFTSIDVEKQGTIDFRSFTISLCVLRSGSLEQRLWFAFRAYDTSGDACLSKIDLFKMIRSVVTQQRLSNKQLQAQINATFAKYDYEKTGSLKFDQFKDAVMRNRIPVNPFWTQCNFENFNFRGFVDRMTCSQCQRVFIPTKILDPSKLIRCPDCMLSGPPTPQKNPY